MTFVPFAISVRSLKLPISSQRDVVLFLLFVNESRNSLNFLHHDPFLQDEMRPGKIE